MFSRPISKPVLKTAESPRSTAVPQHLANQHPERSIDELTKFPLQAVNPAWNALSADRPENGGAGYGVGPAIPRWSFSKVPIFSKEREELCQFSRISFKSRPQIQTKLKVGAINDPLEHEAETAANHVMRKSEPLLQRACACGGTCPKCNKGSAMTGGRAPIEVPAIVEEVLASPGRPLDQSTRELMESRFGHDFSHVCVHSDAKAADSARAVNSFAYTVGRNVVFDTGMYSPGNSEGQRLLAHELAHVIQQGGSEQGTSLQRFAKDEVELIVADFQGLLTVIKKLIDHSPSGAGEGLVDMDHFVEIAGGSSTGRALGKGIDKLLSLKKHTVESATIPSERGSMRYLFTCRCGLIDLLHYFQLLYVPWMLNMASLERNAKNANRDATEMGRKHELESDESESRFAAEDTPSNALGAFTGKDLGVFPKGSELFNTIKDNLTLCGPVGWKSLSTKSQDKIVNFYGDRAPDPTPKHPGDKIPKAQNESAVPDVLDIKECGGQERSYPFGLDPGGTYNFMSGSREALVDQDKKTIADTRFAKGSRELKSGAEIRDFVATQRPEVIRELPVAEKIRLMKVLSGGYVSEEDQQALNVLRKNSSPEEVDKELDSISPSVKPLESATLHVDIPPPNYDGVLLPLLEERYQRKNQAQSGQRVAKLKDFFGKLEQADAKRMLARLRVRLPNDKLSKAFHDSLSSKTRNELLKILER